MAEGPDAGALGERLTRISTGTLATILRHHGLTRVWMSGPRPLGTGQRRVAGQAFTVRFVPAREDLTTSASLVTAISFRAAIDQAAPGQIMVASTGGIHGAGVIGDVLAERMLQKNFLALVTDGAVRDLSAVVTSGLLVWAEGSAAPPSIAALHYCETGFLIGCAGVAVAQGDYVVADDDGVVVVPAAIASDAAAEGEEKEQFERWALSKVKAGHALTGLYPPSAETKARYVDDVTAAGTSKAPKTP